MAGLGQGFPATFRLKKPAEFKQVFVNPLKSADQYFTLLATPNGFGHPRLGLAIAKKVVKRAVDRNLLKRTIRESFRLNRHRVANVDIVVLAKKDAVTAESEVLRQSLHKHWLRLTSKCV